MPNTYNDLITQTFCENSIRSVMMIDDHFLPYSQYMESLADPKSIAAEKLDGTKRATKLMSFFHDRSMICDVDNGAEHITPEKIRKSDLLVLDYHLENDSPLKSLGILKSLRDTNHMNMVVIYTSEPLNKVWLEVSSSLKGAPILEKNEDHEDLWEDLEDENGKLFAEYKQILSSYDDLSQYILTGNISTPSIRNITTSTVLPRASVKLKNQIAECVINDSHNKLKSPHTHLTLKGDYGDVKWISIGHLFIALCEKTDSDNDSQIIWSTLETALHHWRPNYYRLLTSEIQNIIEDSNFAMKGYLESDYEGQAAWLWRLKYSNNEENLLDLYKGMNELLWDEIKNDVNLINFSKEVIDSCYEPAATPPVNDYKKDPLAWIEFNKAALLECAEHTYSGDNIKAEPKDIVHALNENISSKPFTGKCVTVGTILYCSTGKQYYLCVSPSCETVQKQYSDPMSKTMKPDRLMKFIRLKSCNVETALSCATHSKYIFIRNENNKIALSVIDDVTDLPAIFFGIVKNHDEIDLTDNGSLSIVFIDKMTENSFVPVAQLKDAYAARFQALASHHAGRIGVDYIQYSSSTAIPVSGNINLEGHINDPEDMIVEGSLTLEMDQWFQGNIEITSDLTINDNTKDNGKRPVKIAGDLAVESSNKKRSDMLIKSDLSVFSRED